MLERARVGHEQVAAPATDQVLVAFRVDVGVKAVVGLATVVFTRGATVAHFGRRRALRTSAQNSRAARTAITGVGWSCVATTQRA